ncbi:hypothetical protein [Virgisporangium aurantiacum]|uniref:Uncharacterized protein n=1 Tax=Virgisporangium aurantiacum TaxID=175570 RepID=A0A8J4DZC3_9ACTN|nr:hypothetical protein [Virgisporangium aurantiacum]GIJ55571.1 hypothetical protein Vau01_030870 [Virgisporangium aurantiacum]
MTDDSQQTTSARLLITSSALLAAAAALGMAGLGVATVALGVMARRRIDHMEVPPTELARRQWRLARAAVKAGAGAWRNGADVYVVTTDPAESREPAAT